MSLQVGVGLSTNLDESFQAGVEAAKKAVQAMGDKSPNLLMVFAAIGFDHPALLKGIRSVTGETPLIGCTTDGEISSLEGATDDSVVVMAMRSDTLHFDTALGEGLDKDPVAAARHAARVVRDTGKDRQRILICLPDCAMTGGGTAVIEGVHAVLGADFPVIGGAPGDGRKLTGTYQYFNDRVVQHGMPVAYIEGPMRLGSGVRSGLRPLGRQATCTKAQGSLIQEIDGKPALEHHREYVGDGLSVPATIANFPYILLKESSEYSSDEHYVARTNFFYNAETGAIQCSAPIPEGAAIKIARATREDILAGAKEAAEQAKAMYGDSKPAALLVFSCSGRKQVLGLDISKEMAAIREVFGADVPTIGFYSYGEFGPLRMGSGDLGACNYHSYTASLFALGA